MAGSGGAEERSGWVPVRIFWLNDLLLDLDNVLQQRRDVYQWERERDWEKEAVATPAADLTAARRLELARRLDDVTSRSWYAFACMLCRFEERLDSALDPDDRPRPDTADWWRWFYGDGWGTHRFVHLSSGQLERVRELRADAFALTQRVRAIIVVLRKRCWDPAAEHTVSGLTQRLHRVQLLHDAVVLRLQDLRRLVDSLIATRGDHCPVAVCAGGGRRGRGGSAPLLLHDGTMRPLLRRSASMHDLADVN